MESREAERARVAPSSPSVGQEKGQEAQRGALKISHLPLRVQGLWLCSQGLVGFPIKGGFMACESFQATLLTGTVDSGVVVIPD